MAVNLVNVIAVVRDAETGEALPGVTVEKLMGGKPSGVIAQTDSGGTFNVPILNIDGLRFSHVGYQSEDWLSAEFIAGTNTVYLVKKAVVLPGVVIDGSRDNSWLWLLLLGGAFLFFNKSKRRR